MIDLGGVPAQPQEQLRPDWYSCADGVSRYWNGTAWVERPSVPSALMIALVTTVIVTVVSVIFYALIALLLGSAVDQEQGTTCPDPGLGGCYSPQMPADVMAGLILQFSLPVGLVVGAISYVRRLIRSRSDARQRGSTA